MSSGGRDAERAPTPDAACTGLPELDTRCPREGAVVVIHDDRVNPQPAGVDAEHLLALFGGGVDFVLADDVPFALDAVRRAGIDPGPRGGAVARDV